MKNEKIEMEKTADGHRQKKRYLKYMLNFVVGFIAIGVIGNLVGCGKDTEKSTSSTTQSTSSTTQSSSKQSKYTADYEKMLLPPAQEMELTKDDFQKLVKAFSDMDIPISSIENRKLYRNGGGWYFNVFAPEGYLPSVKENGVNYFGVYMKRGKEPKVFLCQTWGSRSIVYIYKNGKIVFEWKKTFLSQTVYDDIKNQISEDVKSRFKKYKDIKITKIDRTSSAIVTINEEPQYFEDYYHVQFDHRSDVVGKEQEFVREEAEYSWNTDVRKIKFER